MFCILTIDFFFFVSLLTRLKLLGDRNAVKFIFVANRGSKVNKLLKILYNKNKILKSVDYIHIHQ